MKNKMSVQTIAGLGLLTAIVVVLQLIGASIRFGMFSISLVLLPIVVGSALYGPWAGAWLGGVFGLVVLLSGDANAFMVLNAPATIFVVMAKGILAGWVGGLVYRLLARKSAMLAAYGSAAAVPIVNTGVFILGCFAFFLNAIRTEWGIEGSVPLYVLTGLVGFNFFFELGVNLLLAPVVVRLIQIATKKKA